jgi:hypothetical protein
VRALSVRHKMNFFGIIAFSLSASSLYGAPLPEASEKYSRGGWNFTEHKIRPEIFVRKRVFETDPKKVTFDIYTSDKVWERGDARLWTLSYSETGYSFNPGPATRRFDTAVSENDENPGSFLVDVLLPNHSHYIVGFRFTPAEQKLELLTDEEIGGRIKRIGPHTKHFKGESIEDAEAESTGDAND